MPTWTYEHTVVTRAETGRVWALLADIDSWPQWDPEVTWARLDAPLAAGATGTLKPARGPKARFVVTRAEAGRRLTDVTRLPFAKLEFDHLIEEAGAGTRLTHRVTISGALAPLFARLIGTRARATLPAAMTALAELAAR